MNKQNINNLKPCPFCGGNAILKESSVYRYDYWPFEIFCDKCGVKFFKSALRMNERKRVKSEIIKKWNRRVNVKSIKEKEVRK